MLFYIWLQSKEPSIPADAKFAFVINKLASKLGTFAWNSITPPTLIRRIWAQMNSAYAYKFGLHQMAGQRT